MTLRDIFGDAVADAVCAYPLRDGHYQTPYGNACIVGSCIVTLNRSRSIMDLFPSLPSLFGFTEGLSAVLDRMISQEEYNHIFDTIGEYDRLVQGLDRMEALAAQRRRELCPTDD